MIDISILKMKLFFLFRNYYSIISAPWPMTDMMNDRYLHHQNEIIFFYFETTTASFQRLDQLLMWWMIHRYVHPQNEIIFFYFETITNYSIISATWPMTDIMNDRYLHPQNEIIFFYFETITASFQHLDQWLI